MNDEEKYIELRIEHRGHPYVAVLGGRCPEYAFQRIFNPFRVRIERQPDGRKQEVHHLPDADLTYEIDEPGGGKRVRWYAATVEGDSNLYRISRYGAEVFAQKAMSLRQVIREYSEKPSVEVEEESPKDGE